jgi:serine/threonine protein kinase
LYFIGDDENQLALIRELRGNIEWPGVHNLPYYLKFQSSQNRDLQLKNFITDYKIYIHERLAINFIDELLTLDPKQRMNINTAVKSDFLQPKCSSEVFKLLLSNYSNEASHNITRNVPHETIY